MLVACGMEDEGSHRIDNAYASYKERCETVGMVALSEFEWINHSVMMTPPTPLKFPYN
ncbi:hypothetical protein [Paenibacillus odorifer]|uniref:hypothetical protein n=1 Tax=Paenibacillus odorifer TaxID=189426 RepID=UPI001C4B80CA|nr:hypothetical protein [Paenibacillus odorifer]